MENFHNPARRDACYFQRLIKCIDPFQVRLAFPSAWNVRPLTEADFTLYCEQKGILVRQASLSVGGYSLRIKSTWFICYNPSMGRTERLFTLMYQLAHCLLHYPGEQLRPGRAMAVRIEAYAFAACALIPRSLFNGRSLRTIARRLHCPLQIVEFRQEVLNHWGF